MNHICTTMDHTQTHTRLGHRLSPKRALVVSYANDGWMWHQKDKCQCRGTKLRVYNYHFFQEKVTSRVLITRFLPSSLQAADIFTKVLPKTSFQLFQSKLGVHKLPLTSLRGIDKGNSNSAGIQSTPKQNIYMRSW